MPSSSTIVEILWRYKKRESLSAGELADLKSWLRESPDHEQLYEELSNGPQWDKEIAKWQTKDPDPTWNKIQKRVEKMSPGTFVNRKKGDWGNYMMVAAGVLLIVAGTFWWLGKKQNPTPIPISLIKPVPEILPVVKTATLTLGDGSIIELDKLRQGPIAQQGGTNILKTDSAGLSYQATVNNTELINYNTLSTPKGSQFQLVLPDGSKVWLNAASTLRFPTAFAGQIRKVELIGEAYFEIVKDKAKPFIVETSLGVSIHVLGTHFNVNAYVDEPFTKADLMEGSISAARGKDSIRIKPGEEILFAKGGGANVIVSDTAQVLAWRNKIFWFHKSHFDEIMRQLSKWYDMEVIQVGQTDQSYTGVLPRNLPLSNVLHILEKGGNVHFTIGEGNKVIVKP
jgi:transmembrane sensor